MTEGIARLGEDRLLRLGNRQARAALGAGGITRTKREGDGATPAGLLVLRKVLFRADRLRVPPRTGLPREPLGRDDGWCDDPASRLYNRQIQLPHSDRHERLWRDDLIYDVIGVLGWNDMPVERDRGSAIFLHVARSDYAPTEGCVAVAFDDLLALLADGMTSLAIG